MISSFSVMIKGMQREQFMQYRMALLPASGFQSAQYRMIELYATPMENLVHFSERDNFSSKIQLRNCTSIFIGKKGATDVVTGEKTLTLKQFEYRYTPRLIRIANEVNNSTIYHKYQQLPQKSKDNKTLVGSVKSFRR